MKSQQLNENKKDLYDYEMPFNTICFMFFFLDDLNSVPDFWGPPRLAGVSLLLCFRKISSSIRTMHVGASRRERRRQKEADGGRVTEREQRAQPKQRPSFSTSFVSGRQTLSQLSSEIKKKRRRRRMGKRRPLLSGDISASTQMQCHAEWF